jgi:hypothetical protein
MAMPVPRGCPGERVRLSFPEENAMQLVDRLGGELPRAPVTLELDDIQATVLRYRPEPYYGTHVMLHVEETVRSGRAAS